MASEEITPIRMPKWGLSMSEGKLSAWHVEEGTEIRPGDEIMDVETDKIANAVEAPDGGLLRRRVGEEDEIYPVGALLGVMAPESVSDDEIDAYIAAYEAPAVAEDAEDAAPAYQHAELPPGRVRYAERAGPEGHEAPPVVLLHGFGGDLDNWMFNIDAIAERTTVYALDLPGHGQSFKQADSPDLDLMVATVVAFIDSLPQERFHLVGHSMGGLVAARIAAAHPDKVAGLVLIGTAGLGKEIDTGYVEGFVAAQGRRDLKPVLTRLFADPGLVNRQMVDDLLKYKRLDGVQGFLESLSSSLFGGGTQSASVVEELKAGDVPVQVIWGSDDAVIPADHAQALDGAEIHVLDGAGHMVQMEKASEVNALILARL